MGETSGTSETGETCGMLLEKIPNTDWDQLVGGEWHVQEADPKSKPITFTVGTGET